MKMKDIKKGRWYDTKSGMGRCESVGGTRPPSVCMIIMAPFPRGKIYLSPRDVIREVDAPESVKPKSTVAPAPEDGDN